MTIDGAIKRYKKEADKYYEYGIETECYEIGKEYEQLAEWLTELEDLQEENKVLIGECDRLIKKKGELLSKVSGGDVLRICQLEEHEEKYKRLLKAAMDDMNTLYETGKDEGCIGIKFKWRFADEALKLMGNKTDD